MCAETGAALVLMHTRAAPKQRLQDPDLYEDVVDGGARRSCASASSWRSRPASQREQLIVDPGPDFAKTPAQTIELLRRRRAPARARPAAADGDLAQGLHRRAHRPRRRASGSPARSPRSPTASTQGAHIFRVHDVAAAADYLRVRARPRAASATLDEAICAWPRRLRYERSVHGDTLAIIHGCRPLSNAAGRQPPNPHEGDTNMAVLDRSELRRARWPTCTRSPTRSASTASGGCARPT